MQEPVKLAAAGGERLAEDIVLERGGGVLNLAIDRPADMARLSPAVLERLRAIAEARRDDAGPQGLVICGAGEAHHGKAGFARLVGEPDIAVD